MRRAIAPMLCMGILLTGCGRGKPRSAASQGDRSEAATSEAAGVENDVPYYNTLEDADLLAYVEDLVYQDAVASLNSEEYLVENVSAVYISKEYLDEAAFNSQSNLYFGYTLAELEEQFRGTKYIFTLSDSGTTTVEELQEIEDTSAETMLKNVAIGTGVILICVTVSIVTAGAANTAVSAIFAASAKTAATVAASSAALGGISAGIVRGIQTGDFNEAVDAAAMGAGEGFKWGAISGAVAGGAGKAFLLRSATKSGLTMKEAAQIQMESGLPTEVIAQLHSMEEYAVYKDAGLKTMLVNGRTALVQKIDLNYVSELPNGTEGTNLARMLRGLKPLDPATGKAYELHHVGQNNDGVLAVLTQEQHRGKGVFSKLHTIWDDSAVDHGADWNKTVSDFWKYLGNYYANGGV